MRTRGIGVVELLVATALGMLAMTALTAAVATGARLLVAAGARGEAEDTAQLAVEAFVFDVRRAGYDPQAAGVQALGLARPDSLTLDADLDGDGVVDSASEEHTTYVCNRGAARLSRVVGAQSMPLADGASGCVFRYLDVTGSPMTPSPTGLTAAERARVRRIALDLVVAAPGVVSPASRAPEVALRTQP